MKIIIIIGISALLLLSVAFLFSLTIALLVYKANNGLKHTHGNNEK